MIDVYHHIRSHKTRTIIRCLFKNHPTEQVQDKYSTDSRNLMHIATTLYPAVRIFEFEKVYRRRTIIVWGEFPFSNYIDFTAHALMSLLLQGKITTIVNRRTDEFKSYYHRDASHEMR